MTTAVYCEQDNRHACALIAKAHEFSSRVIALCESYDSSEACLSAGADEAVVIGIVLDDCTQATRIAHALTRLSPDTALFCATVRGRFLSSWVAAKLDTGLTADCTFLGLTQDGYLLQSRPAFGGNLTADIVCRTHKPQMASVRPGVFPMPDTLEGKTGPVRHLDLSIEEAALLTRVSFTPTHDRISLQSAPVIVTGGKGIGGRQGFAKLYELANLLGGAVGATRSAVDAGYIDYAHQIGQTGITVRPRLYIAFALSGMTQHTVGMNGADTVIAVNRDRSAPIFSYANYGIVCDWEVAADRMIAILAARSPAG